MIHQPEYVKTLLRKYAEGTATQTEMHRLKAVWQIYTEEEILAMMAANLQENDTTLTDKQLQAALPGAQKIIQRLSPKNSTRYFSWSKAVAACALLILFITAYYITSHLLNRSNDQDNCTAIKGFVPTRFYSCTLQLGKGEPRVIDSSVKGSIARIGNIEVLQITAGLLEFRNLPDGQTTDTVQGASIFVSTGVRQQYLVHLPDGTKVRLNATSFISMPLIISGENLPIWIGGEAYVQMPASHKNTLDIKTWNARLKAKGASFVITTFPAYTNTILRKGSLQVADSTGNRLVGLKCGGDQGIVRNVPDEPTHKRDTIVFYRNQDIARSLVWTKAERVYKGVPLRKFAADMARWYGLKFSSLNCIPENLLIKTRICYQASPEEALARIEQAGVNVYRHGEMISFCDPKNNKTPMEKKIVTSNLLPASCFFVCEAKYRQR